MILAIPRELATTRQTVRADHFNSFAQMPRAGVVAASIGRQVDIREPITVRRLRQGAQHGVPAPRSTDISAPTDQVIRLDVCRAGKRREIGDTSALPHGHLDPKAELQTAPRPPKMVAVAARG